MLLAASGMSAAWAEDVPEIVAPAPLDPERLQLGREIVDLGFPEEERQAMFFGSVDSMIEQLSKVQLAQFADEPAVKTMVEEGVEGMVADIKPIIARNIPMFMESYAKAYAREFTRDELIELRAFVTTPTGRHFMSRSTQILNDPDFKASYEAYLRELNPVLQAGQKALIEKLLIHFRDRPPQPAKAS
ncbi:MAG: DUF2059 domain-containing protein [Sphingobium sp.]